MREAVTALWPDAGLWTALAAPGRRYRYCANARPHNWLFPANSAEQFCAACRHNRMIPDLAVPDNLAHWRLMGTAKHQLFYTLLKLKLLLATRAEDPDGLGSISSSTARRR